MIDPKANWWVIRIDAFLYYAWKHKSVRRAWELSRDFCNDASIELDD